MKILLLSPPSRNLLYPPQGIAYIASFLNQKGHNAVIVEGHNKTQKELIDATRKIQPDIVGITMNTSTRFLCLALAKEIKKTFRIPILLGGPHPTLMPEQLLKNYPYIDYIIRNEGEYASLELLNALESKKNLSKIKGLSYRKDKEIMHNEQSSPILDLDKLPSPEYKFFDLKSYSKHAEHPKELLKYPVGSVISSRGCPFQCTFCSSSHLWGHKIRFRTPKNVVDEMLHLYSNYNVRYMAFNDDNFTADRKRAIEICKLIIKNNLHKKIKWLCKAEVNLVNRELLEWLKKAGCHVIEYGVEDSTPEGLKFFKKPHTIQQVLDAFKLTHEIGLEIRSYFIIGGDHESPGNIILKKKFIEKLDPATTTASLLLAYPKTEVYEKGKQRGLWNENIFLTPCVGKEFHFSVPIYTSGNMSLEQMFEASADIDFWWNKKKGNINLKDLLLTVLTLIKNKDFSKIYSMGKSVIKQNLGF